MAPGVAQVGGFKMSFGHITGRNPVVELGLRNVVGDPEHPTKKLAVCLGAGFAAIGGAVAISAVTRTHAEACNGNSCP